MFVTAHRQAQIIGHVGIIRELFERELVAASLARESGIKITDVMFRRASYAKRRLESGCGRLCLCETVEVRLPPGLVHPMVEDLGNARMRDLVGLRGPRRGSLRA
jgi:hypothetical protein